jgi:hypothetical protein
MVICVCARVYMSFGQTEERNWSKEQRSAADPPHMANILCYIII